MILESCMPEKQHFTGGSIIIAFEEGLKDALVRAFAIAKLFLCSMGSGL